MRVYKYEIKKDGSTYMEVFTHDDGHLEFSVMPADCTNALMASVMEGQANAISRLVKHDFDKITINKL
jgi:hypothetical protein